MMNPDSTDPKQRILNTAIALFARKGFSATGVREIAQEADVNIAMINYYFGSKGGILEAMLDAFFESYQQMLQGAINASGSPERKIRSLIRSMIGFFRKHTDLARIVFTELPFDMPEIAEFKAKKVKVIASLLEQRFFVVHAKERVNVEIIGPAIAGIIAFHFLQRPMLEAAFNLNLDDAFYERYAEEIADLILYGIHSKLEVLEIGDCRLEIKRQY
jgi:AcrR family transcriptional regulator